MRQPSFLCSCAAPSHANWDLVAPAGIVPPPHAEKARGMMGIDLARQQFEVARHHSVIGYEASNQYYYNPLDLVEEALNCRYVMRQLDSRWGSGEEE